MNRLLKLLALLLVSFIVQGKLSAADSTELFDENTPSMTDSCTVSFDTISGGIPFDLLQANATGVAPFTYLWNNGDITAATILNGADSILCVTVTDAVGCVTTACHSSEPEACNIDLSLIYQNGVLNGITNVPNGVLSFEWSTGETTASIVPVESGQYCLSMVYTNACTITKCVYVNNYNNPNDTCYTHIEDFANGALLQAQSYGVAPFTYQWSNGATTDTVPLGTDSLICVTVTDAIGCVSYACSDDCNEAVNIDQIDDQTLMVLSSASENITYLWNTGETSPTIQPTASGLYCVDAYFGDNCIANDCIYYWVPIEPNDTCFIVLDTINIDNDTYWMEAQPAGTGTGPYSYLWSNGDTTASIIVTQGEFPCVTVTDAQGCVAVTCDEMCDETATVIQSDSTLTVSTTASENVTYLWSTGETTAVISPTQEAYYCVEVFYADSCFTSACAYYWPVIDPTDSCSVSIEHDMLVDSLIAHPTGVAPFSYNWSIGSPWQAIPLIGDTTYCVTVTDATGCQAVSCIDGMIGNNECNGDVYIYEQGANLYTTTNVQEDVSYYWNTGATSSSITPAQSGWYSVSITYGDSCIAADHYYYDLFTALDSCLVDIHVYDYWSTDTDTLLAYPYGTAPFTYQWGGGSNSTEAYIFPTIDTTYCVTVTDATGCQAVSCVEYNSNACNENVYIYEQGTSLYANTGAQGDVNYYWNTGATSTSITPTDSGWYSVSITYGDSCTATRSYYYYGPSTTDTCWVDIIVHDSWETDIDTLLANAYGTAPFTYQWGGGSNSTEFYIFPTIDTTYCVTVTDATGCESVSCIDYMDGECNESVYIYEQGTSLYAATTAQGEVNYYWGEEGVPSTSIIPTQSGWFTVTMTYGDSCTATSSYYYELPVVPDSCSVEIISYIDTPTDLDTLCAVPYGIAPFSYQWGGGSNSTSACIIPQMDTLYCVTVTDFLGCQSVSCIDYVTDECSATAYIYEQDANLYVSTTAEDNLAYLWSTGETSASITPIDTGWYSLTLLYGDSCSLTSAYYYNTSINTDSCSVSIEHDVLVDSLIAHPTGVAPFSYNWSIGSPWQAIPLIGDTTYCVTVTDAVGCQAVACWDAIIAQPLYTIYGHVEGENFDTTTAFGTVELYQINNGFPSYVASTFGGNYYNFTNLEEGQYIVRAVFDGQLPTYHYSSIWWNEADVIDATTETYNIQANVYIEEPMQGLQGNASITGSATSPEELVGHGDGVSRNGDAVEGATIILANAAGEVIGFDMTDEDGAYRFENLAYGTYTVSIELLGYEQVHYTIVLSEDNVDAENIDFIVDENSISTATKEALLDASHLQLYPNPVNAKLNLSLSLDNYSASQISVVNVTGQTVYTTQLGAYEQNKTIDVADLSAGLYLLKLTTDSGIIVKQFVKK